MKSPVRIFYIITISYWFSWHPAFAQIGIKSVIATENRSQSGKLDGIQKYSYTNGNLFAEYDFVSDKLWNVITLKDIDGNLLPHGNFKDGNGTLIIYNDSAQIVKKANYMTGMFNDKYKINVDFVFEPVVSKEGNLKKVKIQSEKLDKKKIIEIQKIIKNLNYGLSPALNYENKITEAYYNSVDGIL